MWKELDLTNKDMVSKFLEIQSGISQSCTDTNTEAYLRYLVKMKSELFLYVDDEHEVILGFDYISSRDNYTITHAFVGKTTDKNAASIICSKKINEFLVLKQKNATASVDLSKSSVKANEWFPLVNAAFEGLDVKVKVTDKLYEFNL